MKRFNKFVATALAASMIVTGVGVLSSSSEGNADDASAATEYVASQDWKNEITIGGWIQFYDLDIKSYDEQVADLAKSGMNLIDSPITTSLITKPTAEKNGYLNGTDEFWDNLETLAQSLNMYYLYHGHKEADKAYEQVKDAARCIGYHLKDEPSSAQMDTLVDLCLSFKEKDPSRMAWVNLYPSYAGATNLGGSYRDYLTKWTNLYAGKYTEDHFYFDHYPFTATESVRSSYFSDLEAVRDVAYKNGKMATGGFTQMGSWNGMSRPTSDMARWSMYSLLAYGMKSISHFCWVAPAYNAPSSGGEGMKDFVLTWDGQKTDLYEPVSILNWQVRQLGYVLANVDVKHAYHTASVPDGAEGLPGSFLAQPGTKGDDFVYSIAYGKDTDEPYLLVFNKALSGEAKDYTIDFDLDSGVKSLTYYKPTDYTMDTLPDPTDLTTLTAPEEVNIDVSSGKATVSFLPGEMKVFKLNGADGEKVEIAEALQTPESSHASGVYAEPQKISLVTGDKGATIYYTTDGSYPSVGAASTKIYDGTLIELGEYDKTDTYCIRAVSVRGSDVSELLDLDIVIVNASRNIAKGKTVKFYNKDLTKEVGFKGFNGAATDIRLVTDGSFDPFNSVLKTDELAWAVLDLGKEVKLDKFVVSFWHDHWFGSTEIKVATEEDLSDARQVWYAGSIQNTPNTGTTIELDEPVTARYVMVYNDHQGEGQYSLYSEIQAYTVCEEGEEILADTENWTSLADGNFINDGSTLRENTAYNTQNWDQAYSYDAKKYKNFIIDANMSIDVADPGAWGFVGFMIYRDSTEALQGQTGHGYVVGIEPKGRVLLWNGSAEIGPKDANIVGWSVGSKFNIKILAYDGTISISVNGKPYMTVYDKQFKGKEGYISIHSGLLPMTVSDLTITELGDDFSLVERGAAVASAAEVKLAVERYVAKSDIIGQLGNEIQITDSLGNKHTVGVTWECDDYDRTQTGNFKFVGTLDRAKIAELGLSDIHGIAAYATVFVRSEVDTSVSENLLAVAASLNENEYTADSWAALQLKVDAMKDLLANRFLVQSDINVGMFQLYDALYTNLVYAGETTSLSNAIADAKAVDATLYEAYSLSDYNKVIETAEAYLAQNLKTYAGVEEQVARLTAAKKALVSKTADGTVFDGEKPELEKVPSSGSCSGSVGGSAAALGFALTAGAAVALKVGKKKED